MQNVINIFYQYYSSVCSAVTPGSLLSPCFSFIFYLLAPDTFFRSLHGLFACPAYAIYEIVFVRFNNSLKFCSSELLITQNTISHLFQGNAQFTKITVSVSLYLIYLFLKEAATSKSSLTCLIPQRRSVQVLSHSYAACILPLMVTPAEGTYAAYEWIGQGSGDCGETENTVKVHSILQAACLTLKTSICWSKWNMQSLFCRIKYQCTKIFSCVRRLCHISKMPKRS